MAPNDPDQDSQPFPDWIAFRKPGDSGKSILVLNVNPLAPALAAFFNSEVWGSTNTSSLATRP